MYKKDCFKETMSVRASLIGRAPVVVNSHHVALLDRSAFKVGLYKYDDDKFPCVGSTPDAEVKMKKIDSVMLALSPILLKAEDCFHIFKINIFRMGVMTWLLIVYC